MEAIRETLLGNEALLLFLVIGIGYLVGQVRAGRFHLGIAAVLFVGLIFGGWRIAGQPPLTIATQITQVGLILFVFVIGLSIGPGFFRAIKGSGIRRNVAVLIALILGAGSSLAIGLLYDIPVAQIAGVFCGGLSNTPALASVTELVKNTGLGDPNAPAVGYSIAYPFGIVGGLLAFEAFALIYRKSLRNEISLNAARTGAQARLITACFSIQNPELFHQAIGELRVQSKTGLLISRLRHHHQVSVPSKYSILDKDDVVVVLGTKAQVDQGAEYFGTKLNHHNRFLGHTICVRRVLVSKKELVGEKIVNLNLESRFSAKITRIRRADIEMIACPDTRLEIGDHLRIVVTPQNAVPVAEFFGDSERGMSELDYTALTLGISLGVLVGLIPLPLPGGASVSLGFAGGPLVVGLILGKLGRTGPLTWSIPLESSKALQHIGLLFFLAGVGVMAGTRFFDALSNNGLALLGLGIATTGITTIATFLLLKYFGRCSVISAMGATSGMQTQPATLARAREISGSDETLVAYATTYPLAMVAKILIAQLIVILGSHFI